MDAEKALQPDPDFNTHGWQGVCSLDKNAVLSSKQSMAILCKTGKPFSTEL